MLRISKARPPTGFRVQVTAKGKAYLRANPATSPEKLPPLWRKYKDAIFEAYHGICAYTATKIIRCHGFHMDHFLPKSMPQFRRLAYTWSNFRLASPGVNSKKGAAIIADPFTVPDQACRIDFLTGKITLNPALPEKDRRRLEYTIRRLGLNEGASLQNRVDAFGNYRRFAELRNGKPTNPAQPCINVASLTGNYPFVASEMLRLGKIEPEDRAVCQQILADLGFDAFKKSTPPSVALPGNASPNSPPSPPPPLQNPSSLHP